MNPTNKSLLPGKRKDYVSFRTYQEVADTARAIAEQERRSLSMTAEALMMLGIMRYLETGGLFSSKTRDLDFGKIARMVEEGTWIYGNRSTGSQG